MAKMNAKKLSWQRRKERVRKKISGSPDRPRLCVFKSAKHIYAQLIDDLAGQTLAAASTRDKEFKGKKAQATVASAKTVGELLAKRAKTKGVNKVVFDRHGFLYHGQVKALADAAREGGLEF